MPNIIQSQFLTGDRNEESRFFTNGWYSSVYTDIQRHHRYDERTPLTKNVKEASGWRGPSSYVRLVRGGDNNLAPHVVWSASAVSASDGTHLRSSRGTGIMDGGGYARPETSNFDFPENLENRAINNALIKLKATDINLAVAFGERAETAEFVADTLKEGVKWVRALRKKDVKAIRDLAVGRKPRQRHYPMTLDRVLKAPSGLVLQNSYALQPLLADVYGAMDAVSKADLADPQRYQVCVKKYEQQRYDNAVTFSEVTNAGLYFFITRREAGFHSCKVRLDYYMENPLLRTLSQLGLTNPLSLAWELLPFSFVVDWLLPVGTFFDAMDADLGLIFRGGTTSNWTNISYKYERDRVSSVYGGSASHSVDWFNVSGSGYWRRLIRNKLASSPGPRLPVFKNPLSATHVTNAIALLSANLKLK